jgi:hypothetical protein
VTSRRLMTLAPLVLMAGCLNHADTQKADDATARFFQLAAAKDYQTIYDEAAPELKNSISEGDFAAMMQRIAANMGTCQPPVKRFDIHINAENGAVFRDQGYTRTCTGGRLNDDVDIALRDGTAKLAGYHVGGAPGITDNASD